MDIAVVGTGYVGLVTSACLADIGHRVIAVDNNQAKIAALQQGQIPIYEPDLEDIVQRSTQAGRLHFTTDLAPAVQSSQVIFIAVGTPSLPSGDADMRFVEAVAKEIGQHLDDCYRVIVNKSTVPIGSGDWVRMLVLEGAQKVRQEQMAVVGTDGSGYRPDPPFLPNFDVVSNPEFLREGSAVWDSFNPDRIVVGSNSSQALEIMRQLYSPIVERQAPFQSSRTTMQISSGPVPFVVTDLASAEMIKYAANALLATKISFINEIANICERVGADVTQVAHGIGLDSRIGSKFLNAGIGWGGSCFPKDISALIRTAADYGYQARILESVIAVNRDQRQRVVEKLQQELKVLKGKTIGLLGLTFKPDTDDMRDAPSLTIIQQLSKLGARVKAYDPIISGKHRYEELVEVMLESSALELAQGCDALVLVTEWQEFRQIPWPQLAQSMRRPLIIDARNALDPAHLTQAGFYYVGVGR